MTVTIEQADPASTDAPAKPSRGALTRLAMRPRRWLVLGHRWLSFALLAWLVVIAVTGGVLVFDGKLNSWFSPGLHDHHAGDVGPSAAVDAVRAVAPADAEITYVVLPNNGRGVYQIDASYPIPGAEPVSEEEEPPHEDRTYYVDPGTGEVNGSRNAYSEGFTWWMYRGHLYLWQDWGFFDADNPDGGWCTADDMGWMRSTACTLVPGGEDLMAWFGVGWLVVLTTGAYLWYWPGVKRWARALRVRTGRGAFTFNLDLHKVTGLLFVVPLAVITVTGIAFSFPAMLNWFERLTPAQAKHALWVPPEGAEVSGNANGREPMDFDAARTAFREQFPNWELHSIMPPWDETATYSAWMSRGFDPWTREAGAGNTYVLLDQYTGEPTYVGSPEEGNVFDQAKSDWQFPLHAGDFGGTATRLLWVVAAIAPLVLAVTGTTMYLVRLVKRRRRTHRPAIGTPLTGPAASAPAPADADSAEVSPV